MCVCVCVSYVDVEPVKLLVCVVYHINHNGIVGLLTEKV